MREVEAGEEEDAGVADLASHGDAEDVGDEDELSEALGTLPSPVLVGGSTGNLIAASSPLG